MAYLRLWRKRKREMDKLLEVSNEEGSDEDCVLFENHPEDSTHPECDVPGAPPECDVPGIPPECDVSGSDSECDVSGSDSECDIPQPHFDNAMPENHSDVAENNSEESREKLLIELRKWAVRNRETHKSISELLAILRKQGHHLPADARTLLGTQQGKSSETKCGGQYVYYGLERGLRRLLSQWHDDVNLSINIDGLLLFKGSGLQFWPILAKFGCFDPFIVANFSGHRKPAPLDDYLRDFLSEYHKLHQNGIECNGRSHLVNIEAIVCDAPARAYLKSIKTHTSYESCERCCVRGEYTERRVVFNTLGKNDAHRTDQDFAGNKYEEHQTGISPFLSIGFPCVTGFSLDYMHMVCLGVVRRLLTFLVHGPKQCRLSVRQRQQISQRLNSLRGCMPSEFARQPRGIDTLERWKATEFRHILLYTGPVVLRNILSPQMWKHSLTLTVAMSILLEESDEIRNSLVSYARELLEHFVASCPAFYGPTFSVYNVHGLLHLHEDVENFKRSLNELSCFPFENYLQKLKKQVRSGSSPIEQVSRRLSEMEYAAGIPPPPTICHIISSKPRDCCFLLEDERFAFVCERNTDASLLCDIADRGQTVPFFLQPCSSLLVNIVFLSDRHQMKRGLLENKDLRRKVIVLPEQGGHVLIPLRHGVEVDKH